MIVEGEIIDPNRDGAHKDVYRTEPAKGLLRFEIGVSLTELIKVRNAFASVYKTFPVTINLIIGSSEYYGELRCPPSQVPALNSGKVQKKPRFGPWISASLKDKSDGKIKLAYALKLGGFTAEGPIKLEVSGKKVWVLKPAKAFGREQ